MAVSAQTTPSVRSARLRIERRFTPSRVTQVVAPLLALVLALLIGSAALLALHANPITVYGAMALGAFGSVYALEETLVKATPLLLIALGLGVAYRMRVWNIGGEGQFYLGAIAATGTALFILPTAPAVVLIPAMLLAGFLGGAAWALIPGLLRAWAGVNEIITSLMLNYVAILLSEYLVHGPWKNPQGYGFPGTRELPDAASLPRLGTTNIHLGLAFGIIAAALLWAVFRWTRWGYEIRVIGENVRAAHYAGMPVARNIVLVMLVSGGLAGIAGMSELAGVAHQLQRNFSPGYGYTAIIVAWLAQLNPWATIVAAVLFAGLLVGGDQLQMSLGLPAAIAPMLQGTMILCYLLCTEILRRYRLTWTRQRTPSASAVSAPAE